MPVLELPRLLHPKLSGLSASVSSALLTIAKVLKAPPDQPNLATVLTNVVCSLEALHRRAPETGPALASLREELAAAARELEGVVELIQPSGLIGRIEKHRAWAIFSGWLGRAPTPLLEALGLECARAYLTW